MGNFDDILDEFEEGLIEKEKINLVAFVVDRSGSMGGSEKFVIDSFNEQLKLAREQNDQETLVSLISFTTKYSGQGFHQEPDIQAAYINRHVDQVKELEEWAVGGGTPLHDAVGMTVLKLKQTVMEYNDKDISVLVIVITDGEENASREYKGVQIKNLINELEAEGNWTVTYMGSSSDMTEEQLFEQSQDIGVARAATASFQKSAVGYENATHTLNSSMENFYMERRVGKKAVKDYWQDTAVNKTGDDEETDEQEI